MADSAGHEINEVIEWLDGLDADVQADKVRRFVASVAELQREARLAQAETLERERCEIARIAVAIKKALQSYEWLIEGRGSYEWDDCRWHDEFKHACHNIRLELEPLEKIGADLSNRTAAASTSSVSVKFIWECISCGNRIETHFSLHINDRPICVPCNAEMEPSQTKEGKEDQ